MIKIKWGKRNLQLAYFNSRLFINGILGLPAQTKCEIGIFKTIFDNLYSDKKIKIFEWGSGFSTIYYCAYLRKNKIDFEWHSVDNNRQWHEIIKNKADKQRFYHHVKLYLKDFPPFWEKPGWGTITPACGVFSPKLGNENDYINLPKLLKCFFDVIIIDGRFRRSCIQVAREVLAPNGVVILHDAQKTHYHVGLNDFRYSRFITTGNWYPLQEVPNKIWVGSMENSGIFEALTRFSIK